MLIQSGQSRLQGVLLVSMKKKIKFMLDKRHGNNMLMSPANFICTSTGSSPKKERTNSFHSKDYH